MEQNVFSIPEVARVLADNYVEARLHTDHSDGEKAEANTRRQEELIGSVARPSYAVLDPQSGTTLGKHLLKGVADGWDVIATRFRTWLESYLGTK